MSHLYLLGVATLTLTSAGFAGSDTNADLQARLEAAEARINELSAATNNNWLNDTRSDEIRSLVHDVLADADNRASLQGSGSTAGYNGGFTVGSADGNWSLKMNGLVQTSWSNVDDEAADTDGWGFDAVNSWMNFSGTVAGDYHYNVRYNWDGTNFLGEASDLEWANVHFGIADGWNLTMGTQKVASSRIALIDDQNQLGINDEVYDVENGATLGYASDDMRAWLQIFNNDGDGAGNDSQYDFNGRLEYMVEGNWGQFDQFTSADGGAAGTLLGFSYMTTNSDGAEDGDSTWTLDGQMQFGGSNLYFAYTEDSDDDGEDSDTTYVAYGMYLDADWEAYVQYMDDSDRDDPLWVIGVNNYWAGQNAKWTTELHMNDADNGDTTTITSQIQLYF
ncbi:MAG: hypothetical protein CMJ26_02795 [Phycisphaerae bacterium]|nr:hypothetical protein [Phycisphaerae bacterium]